MTVNQALDTELSEAVITPGQSLSGWTFFSFPKGFAGVSKTFEARITVSDFAGHEQSFETKGRRPDFDAIPGGHNSFTFSNEKLEINSYNYIKYTDLAN
jgi:hypothetical protein